MSFYEFKMDDRLYYKSDIIDGGGVIHGFTTRLGGVSHGRIAGFNLGFRVGDDKSSVKQNYRLLADDLGTELERTVLSKQTHTDNIRVVTEKDCGKGVFRASDIEDTDGLITNIGGIALVIFSADCVPILLSDTDKGVVAAVHAGWRGSVKNIAAKAVLLMRSEYGCDKKNIHVAIGPSIGPCCFEFGEEAAHYFGEKVLRKTDNGKYLVDLWTYNKERLTEAGVLPQNIDVSGICTVCRSDIFYSYRTHGKSTGRQGAVIALPKP